MQSQRRFSRDPNRGLASSRLQRSAAAVALLTGSLVFSQPVLAQSCRAADSVSASITRDVKQVADTGSAEYAGLRSKLHLPAVPATQVRLVADDSRCKRAREALDSLIHATNPEAAVPLSPRALYVIQMGRVMAVNDPSSRAGEYSPIVFFNSEWSYLGQMLGY